MKIVVTGCAGFIGSYVSEYLLKQGETVIGIDNLNNYYNIDNKMTNITILKKYNNSVRLPSFSIALGLFRF